MGGLKVIITKLVTERLKVLLIKWIYDINVPFSVVKYPSFRKLLSLLNTTVIKEVLPKSYNIIKKWISKLYGVNKVILRKKITTFSQRIHLSFDS